jgi:hypothetical protein
MKAPDYLLVLQEEGDPEIHMTCDKEDLDELKEFKVKNMCIYKRVGK